MLNAFPVWLRENWDIIVDIIVWGLTALAVFVVIAKTYKILKVSFEIPDLIELLLAAGWILFLFLFGFNHLRVLLQGVL